MSDSPAFNPAYEQAAQAFGKFVPGFDFLQALVQNAGKALPSVGQWVAPTLDPAELERRIEELRTVQFWLEQNARMLGVTIQALEVQRMTLGTLKGMNVSMTDLSEALKVRVPDFAVPPVPPAPAAPAPAAAAPAPAPAADPGTGAAPIDPGQWWGALTQQFTQLATQAMQASSQAAQDAAGQAQEVMQASAAAMEGATAAAAAAAAASASMSAAAPAASPAAAPRKAPARRAATADAAPAPASPKPAARRAPARKAAAKRA